MPLTASTRRGFSWLVLGVSVFWLLLGWQASCYERGGVTVQGTVLSKSASGPGRAKHTVEYRFTTSDGRVLTGRSDVLPGTFARLRDGASVAVEYLPQQPHVNRVTGQIARARTWLWMALAGGVLTLWLRRRAGPAPTPRLGPSPMP